MAYNFSNTAATTSLTAGINNAVTSITVGSVSGFPVTFPYSLIIENDTASREVVTVTAAAGTTLTVTRGQDGTSASSHSLGAAVIHGVVARDLREPSVHIDATSAVHGVSGSVVGTTSSQTLTNKTMNGGANTFSNIPTSALSGNIDWANIVNEPTTFTPSSHVHAQADVTNLATALSGKANTSHTHAEADVTSLVTDLAGKAATSHTHTIANVTSLQSSLDAKLAATHSSSGSPHVNGSSISIFVNNDSNATDGLSMAWNGGATCFQAIRNGGQVVHNLQSFTPSSIKYKENIREYPHSPEAVLSLTPVKFDYKDGSGTGYGLIAEDVDKAGLPELVWRSNGEIESVRYDLLAVALLNVVQAQERRIEALEAKLAEA